jgi:hypothetical protein
MVEVCVADDDAIGDIVLREKSADEYIGLFVGGTWSPERGIDCPVGIRLWVNSPVYPCWLIRETGGRDRVASAA